MLKINIEISGIKEREIKKILNSKLLKNYNTKIIHKESLNLKENEEKLLAFWRKYWEHIPSVDQSKDEGFIAINTNIMIHYFLKNGIDYPEDISILFKGCIGGSCLSKNKLIKNDLFKDGIRCWLFKKPTEKEVFNND